MTFVLSCVLGCEINAPINIDVDASGLIGTQLDGFEIRVLSIKPQSQDSEITLEWSSLESDKFKEYKLYRGDTQGLDNDTGTLIYTSIDKDDTIFVDPVPYESVNFYRAYIILLDDSEFGSNVVNGTVGGYPKHHTFKLNQKQQFFLTGTSSLYITGAVKPGSVYQVRWWDDLGIQGYADQGDSTLLYFDNVRYIPEIGGPRTLKAFGEHLRVVIQPRSVNSSGLFSFRVTDISHDAFEGTISVTKSVSIEKGESRAAVFELTADQNYNLFVRNTGGSEVRIECFDAESRLNCADNLFEDWVAHASVEIESRVTSSFDYTPKTDQSLVVAATAGVFQGDGTVDILVSENP